MHTWNVCKDCNSNLGTRVDPLLTNHYLMQWERYIHQLKGESGKLVPNPFEGTHQAEDGKKYKIVDDSGILTPHVIPEFKMSDDGNFVQLTLDPQCKHLATAMMSKFCVRKKLPFNQNSISQSSVQTTPSPMFNIQTQIDVSQFRLGILKIAYEFAISMIPSYFADSESIRIASILEKADLGRINEVQFGEPFAEDLFPAIFEKVIDFSNIKRHYILLINLEGKMYCFVKLFNIFCIGIKLSDSAYVEACNQVIAINDFGKKTFDLYTLEELVTETQAFEAVSAEFSNDWNIRLQILSKTCQIGFYCDSSNQNLCFNSNCKPIGNLKDFLATIPFDYGDVKYDGDRVISTIPTHGKLCFLLSPLNEYVPVEAIQLISCTRKI